MLLQLDYLNKNYPQSTYEQKARVLGVSVSTVHKWMNQYKDENGSFDPYMADKLIKNNIRKRGRRTKFTPEVDKALITLIRDYKISIDNIVSNIIIYLSNGQVDLLFNEIPAHERAKRNILIEKIKILADCSITSKQTFYNWINEGKTSIQVSELSLQRKRLKNAEKHKTSINGVTQIKSNFAGELIDNPEDSIESEDEINMSSAHKTNHVHKHNVNMIRQHNASVKHSHNRTHHKHDADLMPNSDLVANSDLMNNHDEMTIGFNEGEDENEGHNV